MPTLSEIQKEIIRRKNEAQDEVRRQWLRSLHEYTNRDTILYSSAFTSNKGTAIPGIVLSVTAEDVQGFMAALHGLRGKQLDLILHSPGGSMEAADQIVQYLRAKYEHIRAIVPQNAMSAATMLACACDEIVMGKHSALGPIDPQVTFPSPTGAFTAPAQAILDEFEKAKEEVAANPATAPLWMRKIQAYPHGFLTMCQTTIDLSREKVAEWLGRYMFQSVQGNPSAAIAEWLANHKLHKTHGRPITFPMAESQGLKVLPLERDQRLQELVLSVFHGTMVTFGVTNCVKMIENHDGHGIYTQVELKPIPVPA